MTHDQLKASIAEVKVLMQAALDSKERDLLGDIISGIGGDHREAADNAVLTTQLDEQAVEFESKHPKLARAVREVMDSLNKMGV